MAHMAWSINYASKSAFENDERGPGDLSGDADGQVAAGRAAAAQIIASGAVGGASKDFTVAISGHTSTDHNPPPSTTTDCIAVNVWQKP